MSDFDPVQQKINVAFKLWLTLLVVFISALAGWLALRATPTRTGKQKALDVGEAFAAGVFLGAGLIHMLGDADASFNEQGIGYPWAPLLCGVVVLALLAAEHVGNVVSKSEGGSSVVLPLTAVAMLSVHSVLMGAAFGITSSLSTAMVVFLAVLAHKGAASFALGLELARAGLSRLRQWGLFLFFVAMFPIGVLIGQSVSHMTDAHPLVEASFSAAAAGTFLFFGTLHGLASSPFIAQCGNTREYASAVTGFESRALAQGLGICALAC